MSSNKSEDELKKNVESSVKKMEKAKKNRQTILAQTVYLGTLGVIFILPVIMGAYLGVWLDNKMKDVFSISWTVSLIIVGVFVGAINVYYFIKE